MKVLWSHNAKKPVDVSLFVTRKLVKYIQMWTHYIFYMYPIYVILCNVFFSMHYVAEKMITFYFKKNKT